MLILRQNAHQSGRFLTARADSAGREPRAFMIVQRGIGVCDSLRSKEGGQPLRCTGRRPRFARLPLGELQRHYCGRNLCLPDEEGHCRKLQGRQVLSEDRSGSWSDLGSRGRRCSNRCLRRMDLLSNADVESWRFGRSPYLEKVIRGSLGKTSRILRILRMHGHDLDMIPSHTAYLKWGKGPRTPLRFSKTGDRILRRPTRGTSSGLGSRERRGRHPSERRHRRQHQPPGIEIPGYPRPPSRGFEIEKALKSRRDDRQ